MALRGDRRIRFPDPKSRSGIPRAPHGAMAGRCRAQVGHMAAASFEGVAWPPHGRRRAQPFSHHCDIVGAQRNHRAREASVTRDAHDSPRCRKARLTRGDPVLEHHEAGLLCHRRCAISLTCCFPPLVAQSPFCHWDRGVPVSRLLLPPRHAGCQHPHERSSVAGRWIPQEFRPHNRQSQIPPRRLVCGPRVRDSGGLARPEDAQSADDADQADLPSL